MGLVNRQTFPGKKHGKDAKKQEKGQQGQAHAPATVVGFDRSRGGLTPKLPASNSFKIRLQNKVAAITPASIYIYLLNTYFHEKKASSGITSISGCSFCASYAKNRVTHTIDPKIIIKKEITNTPDPDGPLKIDP